MSFAVALMLAAPAYGLAATQIERSGDTSSRADCLRVFKPEVCGVQPTVPTPEPVEQFDETGFPLLDPADVNKYCDHYKQWWKEGVVFTDAKACLINVQNVYDAAKLSWHVTFDSAHPNDTQIALKETEQWPELKDRRDKPFNYYTTLQAYLEVHLEWHRSHDPREFKP